ncbi:MAG TPA: 30S ribosomal protein S8 [Candidatus Portnoybacteria bacterium]|nr:30S ribosomal protein S8 [Candidatus Portnoybacteria bacterium]
MIDPVADFLIRIKNAYLAKKKETIIPFSKLKKEISLLLKKENLIEDFSIEGKVANKRIKMILKYQDGRPSLSGVKMISKQGRRVYKGYSELYPDKNNHRLAILTTSKGLITDREAKKTKIGGEVICEIYE